MTQVGSLVECINDSKSDYDHMFHTPNGRVVKQEIYTIIGEAVNQIGPLGWLLEEKPCMWITNGRSTGWQKSRFKEVQPPMNIEKLLEESVKVPELV